MPLDLNRQRAFMLEMLIALMTDYSAFNTYDGYIADCAEINTRVVGEGLPFVTSTLPSLGKALERSFETGYLEVPSGFSRSKRNPGLPAFLQDVLARIYDSEGRLHQLLNWVDVVVESGDETSVRAVKSATEAVKFVRQLCYLGYKLELPRDEELDQQFVESWVATDRELPEPDDTSEPCYADAVCREFTRLIDGVSPRQILPKHGPGAVATGERDDQKWAFKRLHPRLADLYDLSYFTVGGRSEIADRPEWVTEFLSSRDRLKYGPCSRMVLVHKDARGPRVVCPEELELMFIQQGLAEQLAQIIERQSFGRVQFRDQVPNGRLALQSSLSRKDATLDLKDASNRVSLWAIRRACRGHYLLPYLEALRSTRVELPSKNRSMPVIYGSLRMFAPMGSALCFPIEAALFYSIAVAAITSNSNWTPERARLAVHVFGDDLIVPREFAAIVMDALEGWFLLVNRTKSFVHGFFRESCGVDAFAGENVTPVKLKKLLPSSDESVSELTSLTRSAYLLKARGLLRAGEVAYREVESHLGDLPFGLPESGYLCRVVSCPTAAELRNQKLAGAGRLKTRVNHDLLRREAKVWRVANPKSATSLTGWKRLLRDLLSRRLDSPDEKVDLNLPIVLRRTWMAV